MTDGMSVPKVKGTNVLAAVKMLRSNRPRAQKVLPPWLHHYLDQRILVAGWYPEEHQLELLRAVAMLLPGTPEPWMTMGRITARSDLAGLYRPLMRPGDPAASLRSVQALWRTYHDTGDLSVGIEAPGRACVRLLDYGLPSREMCRIVAGYCAEMATLGGATKVDIQKLLCVLDGAPACEWRLTFG
jgi:hypothetical protein